MFVIDGPMWFVGALLICGVHAIYLWSWRRERRAHLAWWQNYDAVSQQRHDEFMRVMRRDDGNGADDEDEQEPEMKEMP